VPALPAPLLPINITALVFRCVLSMVRPDQDKQHQPMMAQLPIQRLAAQPVGYIV